MKRDELQKLITYVTPYYEAKDPLHGISHGFRILDAARAIAQSEGVTSLDDVLTYGALFHGLAAQSVHGIRAYFSSELTALSDAVVAAAVASLGKSTCTRPEEQVLHDAHVIEGGGLLYYLKPLLTGTYMHQSLDDTLSFIDSILEEEPYCYFEYSCRRVAVFRSEAIAMHARLKAEIAPGTGATPGAAAETSTA